MYGYGFLSRGFTDRREILRGGSATPQTCLLPFLGDSPRDGRVLGVNRGHMAGYASCRSTCWGVILQSRFFLRYPMSKAVISPIHCRVCVTLQVRRLRSWFPRWNDWCIVTPSHSQWLASWCWHRHVNWRYRSMKSHVVWHSLLMSLSAYRPVRHLVTVDL